MLPVSIHLHRACSAAWRFLDWQHGVGQVLAMLLAQVLDPGVMVGRVVEALLNELVPVLRIANDFGPVSYPDRVPLSDLDPAIRLVELHPLLVNAFIRRVSNQHVCPPHIRLLEAVILCDGDCV